MFNRQQTNMSGYSDMKTPTSSMLGSNHSLGGKMKITGFVKLADDSLSNQVGIEKFINKVEFKIQGNRQKEYLPTEMLEIKKDGATNSFRTKEM